jgi:hypothetical protein
MFSRVRVAMLRTVVVIGLVVMSAAVGPPVATVPGMMFRLKVTLRDVESSGKTRTLTLLGHGAFGAGRGRIDIDSTDGLGPISPGDFFIVQDTLHMLWARHADMLIRTMDGPLVNPLEGIRELGERIGESTSTTSNLRVVFDTVSLDETVNGIPARHFRITADAMYPIGNRAIAEKVILEQWLAKIPISIVNPFGSRIRGLPDVSTTNGDYRIFLNTLAAANRIFGEAVTLRTVTTTSYNYGGGMQRDFYQTVEILDLKQGEVDPGQFAVPNEFRRKPPAP